MFVFEEVHASLLGRMERWIQLGRIDIVSWPKSLVLAVIKLAKHVLPAKPADHVSEFAQEAFAQGLR